MKARNLTNGSVTKNLWNLSWPMMIAFLLHSGFNLVDAYFVGKISVLEKLEHKYSLTFGIKSTDPEKLYKKIDDLFLMPNRKKEFQLRRQKMLVESIDVTAFMVWFVENYPNSVKIMKDNPDYQWKFI